MPSVIDERQAERLQYIDLCAYVLGAVNRNVLMNRFEIKQVLATRDISAYQEMSGENLTYDLALKCYRPSKNFVPRFIHNIDDAIQLLCDGTVTIDCEPRFVGNASTYRLPRITLSITTLYPAFQAQSLSREVVISYMSVKNGPSTRTIAPHSLFRTGTFVYLRAFDHKSGEFRSFKLNRIIHCELLPTTPAIDQRKEYDDEWQRQVTLVIKVNEGVEHPESIAYDYNMENGELRVKVKKALVMFCLMDWNVAPLNFKGLPGILFPLKLVEVIE
jgi:hypothetical protein